VLGDEGRGREIAESEGCGRNMDKEDRYGGRYRYATERKWTLRRRIHLL
jgi:hypothetical protein